jgi:hypothetical protein
MTSPKASKTTVVVQTMEIQPPEETAMALISLLGPDQRVAM